MDRSKVIEAVKAALAKVGFDEVLDVGTDDGLLIEGWIAKKEMAFVHFAPHELAMVDQDRLGEMIAVRTDAAMRAILSERERAAKAEAAALAKKQAEDASAAMEAQRVKASMAHADEVKKLLERLVYLDAVAHEKIFPAELQAAGMTAPKE